MKSLDRTGESSAERFFNTTIGISSGPVALDGSSRRMGAHKCAVIRDWGNTVKSREKITLKNLALGPLNFAWPHFKPSSTQNK